MDLIKEDIQIRPLGDSSIVVQLGEGICPRINKKVISLVRLIEDAPFKGFIEAVPCYNNLSVFYNPVKVYQQYQPKHDQTIFNVVSDFLMDYIDQLHENIDKEHRLIKIPVIYGSEYGPDLDYVAEYNQISPEEVINYHTEKDYLVYMLGFAPGFPFLGGIHEKISTPRKSSPRPSIPKGSVGIAGEQTGVYPFETPGGWQLIGRTAVELFTPNTSPPTLLKPGDKIHFTPITEEEFIAYKENKS